MNKKIKYLSVASLLKEGKIEETNKYLGHYFSVSGIVRKGYKTGRTIGFPTTNLFFNFNQEMLPKYGCYTTLTRVEKKYYFGLTCLKEHYSNGVICETWLENFAQNIYKKKIKIFFLRFYRDNLPFISINNIQKLIQNDLKQLKIKPKINYEMLK